MNVIWKIAKKIFKGFSFFSPTSSTHKAQLTLFFMVVISIILAITMVAINIGKIARDKTHADNSADAGALAGASVAAYAFNYVAEANKASSNTDQRLEKNWKDFRQAMDKYYKNIQQKYIDIKTEIQELQDVKCCLPVCAVNAKAQVLANQGIGSSKEMAGSWRHKVDNLIKGGGQDRAGGQASDDQVQGHSLGVIRNYWKLQEDFFIAMRERVQDDQSQQNDLYQNALSACYRYNLYNSGFPVKMGEDSKQFYEWVDSLSPTKVSNGNPETFTWTDGAGRSHMVTATCSMEDFKTWSVNYTSHDRNQVERDLETADQKAQHARQNVLNAGSIDQAACDCIPLDPACTPSVVGCSCQAIDNGADASWNVAKEAMTAAMQKVTDVNNGLQPGGAESVTKKNGTENNIIVDIQDITSNAGRTISSSNFQFHMGGVVKGRRADVDVPTIYPPVQSSATASFRGRGSVTSKNPAFDASLISSN